MDNRQVPWRKAPIGHDFDETTIPQKFRLDHWRKLADACSGQQSGGQAGIVIHREMRREGDRLRLSSALMHKGPTGVASRRANATSRCFSKSFGVFGGSTRRRYAGAATSCRRYVRIRWATSDESLSTPSRKLDRRLLRCGLRAVVSPEPPLERAGRRPGRRKATAQVEYPIGSAGPTAVIYRRPWIAGWTPRCRAFR